VKQIRSDWKYLTARARLVWAQLSWLSIRDPANFSVEMVKAEQDGVDTHEAED
jgi:hypothetical protein